MLLQQTPLLRLSRVLQHAATTPRNFSTRTKSRSPIGFKTISAVLSLTLLLGVSYSSSAPSWQAVDAISTRTDPAQLRRKKSAIESKENELARASLSPPPVELAARRGGNDGDSESAWDAFASRLAGVRAKIPLEWPAIGDNIAEFIIPIWAKLLPDYVVKLQRELSMAPGSLADEIWLEAQDPDLNPEVTWRASVRVSNDLCIEEKAFLRRRKERTTVALAKYLGLKVNEVHPDDVPTIALCGSGGGLRALVAGSGSYLSAHEAGLLDCVTYTAGVSGSCWLQAIYHSSLAASGPEKIVDHLKARLGVHIAFPPAALNLLTAAPTNKFLLRGVIEKLKGDPDADFGLVDIYGVLLAGRLLVPKGELGVDDRDLKLSNQKQYIEDGSRPLPIYTAVRHEIPLKEMESTADGSISTIPDEAKERAKQEAWFQWFEMTPYELWSEELGAGIPSWAIGRKFNKGQSLVHENGLAQPEVRLSLLFGVWGSAFCATLSHYYREIRPLLMGVAGFGGLDEMISERNEDLIKVHPIDPATFPNFAMGMKHLLPPTCPESIFRSPHLQLMDAGMSNNLPLYPLMRPGREIDVIIAFDASADVKTDNWLSVADGYARQRGIVGWPMGAGWPKNTTKQAAHEDLTAAEQATVSEARRRSSESENQPTGPLQDDLGYIAVWVGSMRERASDEEPPPSKRLDADDWSPLRTPDAGIALVYFPFLANPKVAGVDPMTSDFMSTWNFVYTPEQIDNVVALARTNFDEGREQTRQVIRTIYERKKAKRLREEKRRLKKRLRGYRDLGIMGAESHHW